MQTESNLSRRVFLSTLAVTAGAARLSGAINADEQKASLPVIPKRLEKAFMAPGKMPNGLQAVDDGLWILDQEDPNKAHRVSYQDGSVLQGDSDGVDAWKWHHIRRWSVVDRFDVWFDDAQGGSAHGKDASHVRHSGSWGAALGKAAWTQDWSSRTRMGGWKILDRRASAGKDLSDRSEHRAGTA